MRTRFPTRPRCLLHPDARVSVRHDCTLPFAETKYTNDDPFQGICMASGHLSPLRTGREVKSMREVCERVICVAGSRFRVRSLPEAPTLAAMQAAHRLKISPLGPYHYKMIAENFVFDTRHIKERLGWQPTLTNEQLLLRAYRYYAQHRHEIHARTEVSARRKPASLGIIRLLKWIS